MTSIRRRLDADARRSQLVNTGLDLAKELPFDQVTAPDVARAAGVSKGLVFHYFPTQRDLQAAVARAAADELVRRLAEVDVTLPPAERLQAGISAFIGYVEQQPSGYATIARGAGSDERLRAMFEDTREAVVMLVAAAIGVGVGDDVRLHLALRGWVALVEEMTLRWIDDHLVDTGVPRSELVRLLTELAHRTLEACGYRPGPPVG